MHCIRITSVTNEKDQLLCGSVKSDMVTGHNELRIARGGWPIEVSFVFTFFSSSEYTYINTNLSAD